MQEYTIDGPDRLDRATRRERLGSALITPALTWLLCVLQLSACDGGESHEVDAGFIEDAGETRDAAGEVDAAMPECTSADTCPPASSPCAVAICEDGSCGFAPVEAGTECRAAAGDCDLAEACDGASAACPDDAFVAAGTECRASAGTCDEAEACTGSAASCPDDSGLAALCRPMTPVQVTELGRNLTISTIDLNGTGTPVASVGPGVTVTLRVAGGWVDTNTDCGGCATQFYVGINGVFTHCLGSTTADLTFDESTTFTSPSTPGVYIINTAATWDWACAEDRPFSTDFGPGSVATLIVE